MASDQDNVSKLLSVLAHPLRREILVLLNEKGECSFTDIMNGLGLDTGKLSFHMRTLGGLVEQTSSGKYTLNKMGENAIRLIADLQAWAPALGVQERDSSLPIATLKKRIFAFLIDFAVVATLFAAATLINNAFLAISGEGFSLDINVILFVLVFWLYSTLLEGFSGQSLGKKLIGLIVMRVDGKKMLYDHAAVRNFGKIFIILPFDLLAGMRIKDKRFQRYFDKFAGTMVIDLFPQSS
jgi:uncharacterized RDD family membrane protein YckC